jgi:large subunit ribosomal protein L9
MKVILLTDIPKVGKRYEVKDFKEGYAQNVLLAKGLAELATPHALSRLADKKEKMNKEKENEVKSFQELVSALNDMHIVIKAKANEKGHLFKAISAHDISKAIKEQFHRDVSEDIFVVPSIKELGAHAINLKKGDKIGKCEITIEAQK